MLADSGFTPETVARAIATQLPAGTTVSILYSEPNMKRWVLRVRVRGNATEQTARSLHSHMRESVLLGGIHGVRAARVVDHRRTVIDQDTGALKTEVQSAVDMEGGALRALATRDWVQWDSVVTNDIVEVAAVLGMVAARATLFAELDRVISTGGGHVDPRHLAQVVATMTHRGKLMPLTRHGINRVNLSVLQRTSFEEPVDMLLQGAAQGQEDPLRGLCECVYVGAKAPIGTGTVAVQEDYAKDGAVSGVRATVGSRELSALPGQGKRFREARESSRHSTRRDGGGGGRPRRSEQSRATAEPSPQACQDVEAMLCSLIEQSKSGSVSTTASGALVAGAEVGCEVAVPEVPAEVSTPVPAPVPVPVAAARLPVPTSALLTQFGRL